MTYEDLMLLADEYNFYPDNELQKDAYSKEFISFLKDKDLDGQIIARYAAKDTIINPPVAKQVNLFSFQVQQKVAMIEGLDKHIVFLNASATGSGKSYSILSLAETEQRPLAIVCPKSMVLEWYLLAIKHKITLLMLCNYETLILGKMYEFSDKVDLDKLPRIANPYLKKTIVPKKKISGKDKTLFNWQDLPPRTLIVFDEAHMCKNISAQRTQLLISAYDYAKHPENRWRKIGIALLSATIIEKRSNLRPFLYVLGYSDKPTDSSLIDSQDFSVRKFGQKLIAERRMSRISLAEARDVLGDKCVSDIRTKMYRLDNADKEKIQLLCQEIRDIILASKEKRPHNHLALRIQKRQEIEGLKIGIMYNELIEQRKAGYSVLVFVNFVKTLDALIALIKPLNEPYSILRGGQTASIRLNEVDKFQKGETKIIIGMASVGGVGISLHDTIGGHPRYSIISPPESATQTLQILGRPNRLNSKSDSKQVIIFIADTIEEKIAESLNNKMKTIGDLNNDDEQADNLFLFEVYHNYDNDETENEYDNDPSHNPKNHSNSNDNNNATSNDRNNGSSNNSTSGANNATSDNTTIQVTINKEEKLVIVSVPDYMVDSFESGLPAECISTMKIYGDKYKFPLKLYYVIVEYLRRLNN